MLARNELRWGTGTETVLSDGREPRYKTRRVQEVVEKRLEKL